LQGFGEPQEALPQRPLGRLRNAPPGMRRVRKLGAEIDEGKGECRQPLLIEGLLFEFQPVKRQPWTEEWFGQPTRGTTKSSIYPAE
jgi:hypothetical protein